MKNRPFNAAYSRRYGESIDLFRNRSERTSVGGGRTVGTAMYNGVREDSEERPTPNHVCAVGFKRGLLPRRQQGVVLLVGLVFLVVLSLLAVGSVQVSILEEKLTGNIRSNAIATQSMEAAIREGELTIRKTKGPPVGSGFSNRLQPDGYGVDYWINPKNMPAYDWSNAYEVTDKSASSAQKGRYTIETARVIPKAADRLGESAKVVEWRVYRITGRGYGLTNDAESLGQIAYQKANAD